MTFAEFSKLLGFRPTPPQRVFCLVAFDGVEPRDLKGREREIARELFGRRVEVVDAAARAVVVAVLGARSGKSLIAAIYLTWRAHVADLSRLAAGEVAYGLFVGPDLRLSRQALAFGRGLLAASPLAASVVASTTDSVTIRRADGRDVQLECLPATRGGSAVRGRTLVGATLEEASFFRDEASVVNDRELFSAVSPRVLPGGQVLVISTPWTSAGLVYDLHQRNHGRPRDALVAHASTSLMREGDAQVAQVVARERERDPRNAAREFDAEFADAAGALLDPRDVDAAIDRGVRDRPPQAGVSYVVCADVGLRRDRSVGLVAHVEARSRGDHAPPARVLVVDAVRVLAPTLLRRVSLDEVEAMLSGLAQRYRATRVHADIHYADALGPRLRARGVRLVEVSMASTAQERRAETLAAAFASGGVRLVDEPVLIKECKGARLTRRAGGGVSVGAPEGRGRHDDALDCLLLAAEVSRDLAPAGDADLRCRTVGSLEHPDGLHGQWERRRAGPLPGTVEWVPCPPPEWSAQRERWEDELRAQGFDLVRPAGAVPPPPEGVAASREANEASAARERRESAEREEARTINVPIIRH